MSKNKLIDEYLPLVKSFAGKYKHLGLPYEDLVQEGLIGLSEAASRFDEYKKTKFSTYASYWIKKKMLAAVEAEKKASLNPTEYHENIAKTISTQNTNHENINIPTAFPTVEKQVLHLLYNEEFTLSEIAEKMNISRERVRQLKEKALRRLKIKQQ